MRDSQLDAVAAPQAAQTAEQALGGASTGLAHRRGGGDPTDLVGRGDGAARAGDGDRADHQAEDRADHRPDPADRGAAAPRGSAAPGSAAPGPAAPGGGGVRVAVRFFAGAAAAAGLDEEVVLLEGDGDLGALEGRLRRLHPALGPVLDVASTLVDEVAVTDPATRLRDGAQVDVLPPFAGG